jgi:predicted RNase H-like HicB family nuclease
MNYVFPAIYEKGKSGAYVVTFPDISGCFTQGDDIPDALDLSHKILREYLECLIEMKFDIPAASDLNEVVYDGESTEWFKGYVSVNLKDSNAVKKTISIPKWMDDIVRKSGISLSRITQDAIKERFAN